MEWLFLLTSSEQYFSYIHEGY